MNKTELVAAMAEQAGLSKKDAEKALKAFTDVVADELKKDGKVQLVGFGTFEVSKRAARVGYYDRYLPRTSCPTMLLCRHQLEREDIPAEEHDILMDYFVTERGIVECACGAGK